MPVQVAHRRRAAEHHRGAVVDERAQCRVEEADLDVATPAGAFSFGEGGRDADRGVEPGHHVGHGDAGAGGRPVGRARHVHDPAHRLGEQVVAGDARRGALGAERADRAVDDAGVLGHDRGVVETERGHEPGSEVLHEYVGAQGELARHGEVVGVGEVEGDALLVAVDREVVGRLHAAGAVVPLRRPPRAGLVAGAGPFDLHDLGPEIGQVHGRQRARQHAGEVGDEEPLEGTRRAHGGRGAHGGCGEAVTTRRARSSRARGRRAGS